MNQPGSGRGGPETGPAKGPSPGPKYRRRRPSAGSPGRRVAGSPGRITPLRILIVTTGSRGDVAPFTGLGRRLVAAGHRVAVLAHPTFAPLIESCGLEYRPLPGDPKELILRRARATSPEETRTLMRAFVDGLADGVADAVTGGVDLLLTAFAPAR
ncbi:glycosyltransferase [Kitasatospora sp. NPDC094011]|uniref:glycosyltransferase n=1 Tax=Kitasatospora sp. NPDC094011 TaxID=3364090 RepID=UPI00380F7358